MLKVDRIKRLFDCDLCNKLLSDPVALPCGYTICQSHVNELLERRFKAPSTFVCELCEDDHVVPANGFALNKKFKSALDIKLNEFKIGHGMFNDCKKALEEVRDTVTELESIAMDPENYLFGYFSEIKRLVDLRREELKNNIDDYSNEIIEVIERTKAGLVAVTKNVNHFDKEIENSRSQINKLFENFDTFEFDDKKINNLMKKAEFLKEENEKMLEEYKQSLLMHKQYSFEYKDRSVEEFFGLFGDNMVNFFESFICYCWF